MIIDPATSLMIFGLYTAVVLTVAAIFVFQSKALRAATDAIDVNSTPVVDEPLDTVDGTDVAPFCELPQPPQDLIEV